MRYDTIRKIQSIAEQNNGYLRTGELLEYHISKTHLTDMVKEGHLEKVKRGLYRLSDMEYVSHGNFLDAQKAIPQGNICFHSAMEYYELSTVNPIKIQMAIPRKSNVTLPDHPPVELFYLTDWYYELGIVVIYIRGEKVRIYSPEKTVCDCIRYKKKIGSDLAVESIKNYVKNYNSNGISGLMEMALKCKVAEQVRSYLEVLLL